MELDGPIPLVTITKRKRQQDRQTAPSISEEHFESRRLSQTRWRMSQKEGQRDADTIETKHDGHTRDDGKTPTGRSSATIET
jgi:hypothetical protein